MEAIEAEAAKVGDETRGVLIIQSGIGDISENDVKAAIAASSPALIGFNVRLDRLGEALARQHGIPFEEYSIIYKLTERLEELLAERGPKRTRESVSGRAKILKVFSSKKDEHLIGARVTTGMVKADLPIRLLRLKEPVASGEFGSMESARKEVTQVGEGGEFGAMVTLSEKPREGDMLESYSVDEY
jgi:translation initiation factor IF-2